MGWPSGGVPAGLGEADQSGEDIRQRAQRVPPQEVRRHPARPGHHVEGAHRQAVFGGAQSPGELPCLRREQFVDGRECPLVAVAVSARRLHCEGETAESGEQPGMSRAAVLQSGHAFREETVSDRVPALPERH